MSSQSDPLLGKTISNYRIDAVLGKGGMGTVYAATDLKLTRKVAIKAIHPLLAKDPGFMRRFLGEARTMAQLEHMHIVRVYELEQTDDGVFIVMEYVEGQTLSGHLPKPWREAVTIFRQALEAVRYAHHRDVIHRDLKPANIMITPQGSVKIMDFGLAKVLERSSTETAMTVTGTTGGTLYYMPPEQVKGLAHVDQRGDLYALGMTFYEALTGRLPFEKSADDYALRKAIVEGTLPPPTTHHPALPRALSDIVMKAIEKDPEDRYQSAQEMLDALAAFDALDIREEAAPVPAQTTLTQGEERAPRRPLHAIFRSPVVLAVLAVLVVVAVGVKASPWIMAALQPTPTEIDNPPEPSADSLQARPVVTSPDSLVQQPQETGETPPEDNPTNPANPSTEQPSQAGASNTEENPEPDLPAIRYGEMVLDMQPSGGVIFVSGNAASPGRAERFPVGRHLISFQHPVYGRKDTTLVLRQGSTPRLTCYFVHYVDVFQRLDSEWGHVVIDQENTQQEKLNEYPLAPGMHTISVERLGYQMEGAATQLRVEPGFTRKVHKVGYRMVRE